MRFLPPFLLVGLAAGAFACVHEQRSGTGVPVAGEIAPPPVQALPSQYSIGDPGGSRVQAQVYPLRNDSYGLIVDKRRVVITRGEPRVATDVAAEALAGATRLPARMGGGFLFWTQTALYRADAFDGKLVPVANAPPQIDSVSLGPGYALVRASNGERWGIGLPKGERVAIAPLGLVDVAASEDGRALAYDDRRAIFTSIDSGAHWTDVTAQMRGGNPTRVFRSNDDEVWLVDSNDNAMRLESDGHLAWFDHAPEELTADFRPKDPRWHGAEPPLRTALQRGVALDDRTALVLDAGDLVKIDTRTGELVSVYSGHLPPDSYCIGLTAGGDIVFACMPRGGGNQGSAFVVSHVLSGEPVIEQTFSVGAQFYASDDGGLVYGAGCNGAAPQQNGVPSACVRTPSGQWEERDLGMLSVDGGSAPGEVVRWIPRADGRVVALLAEPTPGLYDPVAGTMQDIGSEVTDVIGGRNAYARGIGRYRYMLKASGGAAGLFVDTSWSYVGTTLRGQGVKGESFEIAEDGKVKMSAYELDGAFNGPMGLGKSKDGRMFQTSDRGVTWTEVAAPPTGDASLDVVACSSVGCDLGAFYRVGWQVRPPTPALPPTNAPPAPAVRRIRGMELACRTSGPVVSKIQPRSDSAPDDLGLGATKLPVADERTNFQYVRTPLARGLVSTWAQGVMQNDSGDSENSPALRAMLSGYSMEPNDSGTLQVSGPNKSVAAFRRPIAYVAPFDLQGHILRTSIGIPEVLVAGRRAGMTTDEILEGDPTSELAPFPIASSDPNGTADLGLFDSNRGLLATIHGERVRVAYRGNASSGNGINITFSGAALPGNADEIALLEFDSTNIEHMYKLGPSGATVDVFDLDPANDTYHSANPDAVAVGPKGELGVLRAPSGSDPPSALDPAYVVVPGQPSIALAPWSTVKPADDPACKAEPGGWRAVVQAIGPWIRTSTPELRVGDSPMVARVRWSPTRVCLEAFEVRLPGVIVKPTGAQTSPVTVSTWLVAKGGQYARVSVAEGVEWRQPLECAIGSTGP